MNEYKNEEMNTGVGNIFKRYYFTILYMRLIHYRLLSWNTLDTNGWYHIISAQCLKF